MSDDSDKIPQPKYLPKKPSRDIGNAENGNFWNGNSGNDGSSGSSDGIGNSSIESNGLDEKPPTVIGVRYFAYLPSLPFFITIYIKFSFPRISHLEIRLLFVADLTFRFAFQLKNRRISILLIKPKCTLRPSDETSKSKMCPLNIFLQEYAKRGRTIYNKWELRMAVE